MVLPLPVGVTVLSTASRVVPWMSPRICQSLPVLLGGRMMTPLSSWRPHTGG
jgi:hypothetical protein